jgi:hypothetical protein
MRLLHVVPGIHEVQGFAGPPLNLMGRRIFTAELLHNSPENMIAWLKHPSGSSLTVHAGDLDLSGQGARDIAACTFAMMWKPGILSSKCGEESATEIQSG